MSEMNHNSKSKLHGIWALTNRELKKWYKEPVLFLLSMIQPIIWMGLLGKSMNISALIPQIFLVLTQRLSWSRLLEQVIISLLWLWA